MTSQAEEPPSFQLFKGHPPDQVSPLKGSAGVLASDTVDVCISQKFNMAITYEDETMPWVLVHDPGMIKIVDRLPKYYRELKKETVGPADNPIPIAENRTGKSKINELVKELIDTDTLQPADLEDFRQFWLRPRFQRLIRGAHEHGNKIFSYFDPQGGQQISEMHRRHRGLGLCKIGLVWAYIHIYSATARPDDPAVKDTGVVWRQNAFVLRGPEGVLDTLSWEDYREEYDDARYLATLRDALAKAKTTGRNTTLVTRTERWLDNLTVHADLDQWHLEMAGRTEKLFQ